MKIATITKISLFALLISIFMWYKYSIVSEAKNIDIYKMLPKNIGKIEKSFQSWLRKNTNRYTVPAAATGIVYGNKLILKNGLSANKNTRFGIASLTKTFTAMLILQLAEQGLIQLDDPLSKHLPGIVIEREKLGSIPVTVRHLLSHTSGIKDYGQQIRAELNSRPIYIPKQVIPAGYNYRYSNRGYVLLKHLIETVTDKSYSENLKNRIFIPLEMTSSNGDHSNGTGGITTTVADLSNYAAMLIQKGRWKGKVIINETSFNEMLSSSVEKPDIKTDYNYSLGWEVITHRDRVKSYYKAGRWYGSASAMQIFPDKKIAFIYLCNPPHHRSKNFLRWRGKITGRLRNILRRLTHDPKLCTQWPSIPADILKDYNGVYFNRISGDKISIISKGRQLYCKKGRSLKKMKGFSSNRFIVRPGNLIHNFVWKDNKVIGLVRRDRYFYSKQNL